MALDKNYDLRIQRITTTASVNAIEIAKAAYDPVLGGNANHGYTRAEPYPYGSVTTPTGQATSADVNISQKIITGATLQIDYGASRSNPRPAPPQNYGSGLTLSVRQPILKNFGSTVNKAAIERARLGTQRSNYDLKSAVLDTVRSVENAYYALAYARANLEVLKTSLDTAQQLYDENVKRREVGVLTELDVLQAKVGVANAQRDIITGQKAVNDTEDSLLSLINPFQFQTAIGPLDAVETAGIDVNFDRSYKLARDNSPTLASMRLAVKQSEIDLAVAKRNRLPQLDIVGSAGYDASRTTLGNAIGDTLNQHNHDWAIGATITYPWGSRAEKATLANAKAALDTNQTGLEQLDQNVLLQVRTAIRAVQTTQEGVRISTLAASLSEQQYNLEKARYDQGLSTFRFVQDMKQDLDNARVAELNARVGLRLALADLARLEGSSLDRYHIKLDESPAN
jgi:outer membrane protein TolC